MVRQDGRLVAADWDRALEAAARLARGARSIVALVSPGASNEALALVAALAGRDGTGAFRVTLGREAPLAGVPGLALRAERAPNVHGALAAGFTRDWTGAVAKAGAADLVIALDESLEGTDPGEGPLLVVGTVLGDVARARATVVLPCANPAEEEGSFTNLTGLVQRYAQARAAPGMARPAAWVLAEIAERAGAGVGAPA